MILLDQPSFQSLLLQTRAGQQTLSSATGFIVLRSNAAPILITNWHVLTGRHIETHQPLHSSAAVPDTVQIAHNVRDSLGAWVWKTERLYDDTGRPRWIEHPVHKSRVDVVGLPLTDSDDDVVLYPYSCTGATGHDVESLPAPLKWGPSDFVNIIGFPFGWTGGGCLGIWVQGAVATEPQVNFEDLPRFLIDSRTREGQSGSPVVIYKRNGWVTLEDGRLYMIHNPITILLGVYSGRLSRESDLGTVWNTSLIAEIVENGTRSDAVVSDLG